MISDKNRFKTTEKLWNLDDKQLSSPVHDALVLWLMEEENARKMLEPFTNVVTNFDFIDSDKLGFSNMDIRSEIPFQAQNGFINGYGDLEITRIEVTNEKYYECRCSEKVLSQIKEAETVGDVKNILKENYLLTEFTPSLKDECYIKKEYYSDDEKELDDWKYGNSYDLNSHRLRLKLTDFFCNFQSFPSRMKEYDLEEWILKNNYHKWSSNHISCLIEVKPYIESFGQVLRQINSYKSFWNIPYKRHEYKYPVYIGKIKPFVCLFTLDDTFDSQFESQGINVLHPPSDFDLDEVMEKYGLR